jgi:amino acid transporter
VLFSIPSAHLTITAAGVVAAASLAIAAAINYVGVSAATRLQGGLTVVKVAGLAAIPLLALALHPASPSVAPFLPPVPSPAVGAWRGDDCGALGVRRVVLPFHSPRERFANPGASSRARSSPVSRCFALSMSS